MPVTRRVKNEGDNDIGHTVRLPLKSDVERRRLSGGDYAWNV